MGISLDDAIVALRGWAAGGGPDVPDDEQEQVDDDGEALRNAAALEQIDAMLGL